MHQRNLDIKTGAVFAEGFPDRQRPLVNGLIVSVVSVLTCHS